MERCSESICRPQIQWGLSLNLQMYETWSEKVQMLSYKCFQKDFSLISLNHKLVSYRLKAILTFLITTGQLIAHVSWQCTQSNPDIQVSGFNVLIDGKQYGNPMHEGVRTVRIKVGNFIPYI